jgi:putative oxidoreductase
VDRTKLLFPQPTNEAVHAALLVLRVVAGAAFIQHGLSKIKNPFGWMGADSAMPGVLQALAAISEFGGGIAWILGALTPLASLGILSTMVVAAGKHIGKGDPFVGRGGSYELALVFLSVALLLLVCGPGRYSVDAFLYRRRMQRRSEPGARV